jgi:polysaccharide export outer membrane protein
MREHRLIPGFLPGFLGLLALAVSGCATTNNGPFVWAQDLPPAAAEGPGTIHPRDTLSVVVLDQPSMSGDFVVHDDGTYMQPTLGNLKVQGKTAEQVTADLTARLKDMVVNPRVNVSIVHVATIKVSVVGEVKTPGSYELNRDRSVAGALAAAGWLTDFASKDRIFVVRPGANTPRVRFPVRDLTAPETRAGQFQLHDGDVVVVE